MTEVTEIALAEPTRVQQNQQVFQLPDGQVFAAPPPPENRPEFTAPVFRSVTALSDGLKEASRIHGDATLSPMGKQRKLLPLGESVIHVFMKQWDAVLTAEGRIRLEQAQLYAVPSLKPGDSAGALVDRECREWFRALTGEERSKTLAQLVGGKHERVTLALLRSPMPLNADESTLEAAWHESVKQANIGQAVDIENALETATWALGLLRRLAAMTVKGFNLNPHLIASALMSMNAEDTGPFDGVVYHPKPAA